MSKGPVRNGLLDCHWRNDGLGRGERFSLVTGRLLTSCYNEFFKVLRKKHFFNTGRHLCLPPDGCIYTSTASLDAPFRELV